MPSERIRPVVAENAEESDCVTGAATRASLRESTMPASPKRARLVLVTHLPFSDSTAQIRFLLPEHFRLRALPPLAGLHGREHAILSFNCPYFNRRPKSNSPLPPRISRAIRPSSRRVAARNFPEQSFAWKYKARSGLSRRSRIRCESSNGEIRRGLILSLSRDFREKGGARTPISPERKAKRNNAARAPSFPS